MRRVLHQASPWQCWFSRARPRRRNTHLTSLPGIGQRLSPWRCQLGESLEIKLHLRTQAPFLLCTTYVAKNACLNEREKYGGYVLSNFRLDVKRTCKRAMKTVLEFVIFCSKRWHIIEVTARQSSSFPRCRSCPAHNVLCHKIADKHRGATAVELRYTVDGCGIGERCILQEAALQIYFRVKRRARICIAVGYGGKIKHHHLTLVRSEWQRLDVRSVTDQWLEKPGRIQRRLTLICHFCKGKVKPVGLKSTTRKPELIWEIHRELVPELAGVGDDRRCALRPRRLDIKTFHQIWGNVIVKPATSSIPINECSGACDVTELHRIYSAHALLRERLRTSGRDASWGRPCCVPTKYEPVTVMTKKNGVFEEKHLNIIIKECGCRWKSFHLQPHWWYIQVYIQKPPGSGLGDLSGPTSPESKKTICYTECLSDSALPSVFLTVRCQTA